MTGAARGYRLLTTIGRGGFGTVYSAQARGQSGFEQVVAIKIAHGREFADPDVAGRIRDEARVLGMLRHRAIVRVDDLIEIEGRQAMVMEYVEGVDLQALIALGPLPQRAACELVREIADALQAAHEATAPESGEHLRLVHRDIKPANVRVTPRGEVKVLDFGVARARFVSRETRTGSLSLGTPGYLAPERFDGVDSPASDVYALGVVFAECLLGRPVGVLPVNPRLHATALAQVHESLRAVSPVLVDTVAALLAYEPSARPTPGMLASCLQQMIAEVPGAWLSEWAPPAVAEAQRAPQSLDLLGFGSTRDARGASSTSWRRRRNAGIGALAYAALLATIWFVTAPRDVATLVQAAPTRAPIEGAAARASAPPPATSRTAPAAPAARRLDAAQASSSAKLPVAVLTARPREAVVASTALPAEPAPVPAVPVGAVLVEGDADDVRLVAADGHAVPAGPSIPIGHWRLRAAFGSVTVELPQEVDVRDGGVIHVRCAAAVENCVVN